VLVAAATLQGVSFYGASDEYVISGSDCGHIFFWSKKDGELLRLMKVSTGRRREAGKGLP